MLFLFSSCRDTSVNPGCESFSEASAASFCANTADSRTVVMPSLELVGVPPVWSHCGTCEMLPVTDYYDKVVGNISKVKLKIALILYSRKRADNFVIKTKESFKDIYL